MQKYITFLLIALFLFLDSSMTNMVLQGESSSALTSIYSLSVFVLIVIASLGMILYFDKRSLYSDSRLLFIFLTLMLIRNIFTLIFFPPGSNVQMLTPFLPLFVFIVFYSISYKISDEQTRNRILRLMGIGILILFISYIINRNTISSILGGNVLLNASYFILYSFPFALLVKNRIWRIFLISISIIAVLLSFKRTGSVAIISSLLVYIFMQYMRKGKFSYKHVLTFTLIIVGIYYALTQVVDIFDNFLIQRFAVAKDDEAGGRGEVWFYAWKLIVNSNFMGLLLGHGFDGIASASPLGMPAHNDFMEIFYDYGVIVFVIYLMVYRMLFKFAKRLRVEDSEYTAPMYASIVLMFICSMTSHIFLYHHYSILFTSFWGFVMGRYYGSKKEYLCE